MYVCYFYEINGARCTYVVSFPLRIWRRLIEFKIQIVKTNEQNHVGGKTTNLTRFLCCIQHVRFRRGRTVLVFGYFRFGKHFD